LSCSYYFGLVGEIIVSGKKTGGGKASTLGGGKRDACSGGEKFSKFNLDDPPAGGGEACGKKGREKGELLCVAGGGKESVSF